MSEVTKVAETSRRGLEPVNPKLIGQYDQLVSLLTSRLGPDHAYLFAEPMPLGAMGTGEADTAWYVKGTGDAVQLAALPQEAASRAYARLVQLQADIDALAERMSSEGAVSQELARFLRDALVVPDAARIYVVDGRPVLVDWGYRLQSGMTVSAANAAGALTGRRPSDRSLAVASGAASGAASGGDAPPPPEAPASPTSSPPPPDPAAWRRKILRILAMVLFALLALALAARLLLSCGLGPLWPSVLRHILPDHCPAITDSPALKAVEAEQRAAEAQLKARELALAEKTGRCTADCPPPSAPPAPQPQVVPDIEERRSQLERGNVEITLAWNGRPDLDLKIICPDGTQVFHSALTGCGGRLMKDMNIGGDLQAPVEHMIFPQEPAMHGTYKVLVKLHSLNEDRRSSIPFSAVLRVNGRDVKVVEGNAPSFSMRQWKPLFDFSWPLTP
jgi:hypothetical protein